MRSHKLLALIFSLLAIAPALAGYMTLLGAGINGISPNWSVNFLTYNSASAVPAELAFSRTNLGTQYDANGYLIFSPNNLALNTATLSTQTVTVQIGINYIISFASGSGSIILSGAGSGTVTNVSPVKITASTTSLTLTVVGTVTNAVVAAVTYETNPRAQDQINTAGTAYFGPRFDYIYNGSAWISAGLLIEQSSTNYAFPTYGLASQNKANSGVGLPPTATDNYTSAVDNTTTATRVQFSLNGGVSPSDTSSFRIGSFAVVNGNTYTGSLYVKSNTASTYTMTYSLGSTEQSVTVQPNVWTRLKQSQTATSTSMSISLYLRGARTPTNDNTADILVWGPQLEPGSITTSLIYNMSSTTTRAADIVKLQGTPLSVAQSNQGSMIAQTTLLEDYGASANQVVIGASASNYRYFGMASGTNNAASDYNGTNSLIATMGSGTWTGSAVRFASGWSASGRSLAANGGTVVTNVSAFPSIGTDDVYVGSRDGASQFMNGWLAGIASYNVRLTDSVLQTKSAVGVTF